MLLRNLLLCCSLFFLMTACSSDSSSEKADAIPPSANATPPAAQAPAETTEYYPSLPIERAQALFTDCDFIDYLYYELPLSMSFKETTAIQSVIRHISAAQAPIKKGCKPIGRITYQKQGEQLEEADMYMSEGCTYFVFFENGKPTYGNLLTPEAITFYQNTINQALQRGKQ
ncbi:MAG: hypothetical protein AAFP19_16370 [Bacteroidota bacterium]